ncbi:hypothetical protein E2I00_000542, partial [Balaenoptera physalus]
QPHPDEGHPPPLEAVPVPWKSVGPCKSHRESLGSLVETPAGKEAQGEEDPAASRLDVVRTQLEQELEELTASLFEVQGRARAAGWLSWASASASPLTWSLLSSQEAHKMVREANMKQAASEKQLKETRGKIDMLQAEVTALKTLVITSTPASPNRELHPQLLSPTKAGPRKGHLPRVAPPPLPAPLRGPQQGGSPHLRAGLAAPAWGAARGPHLCYLSLLFPTEFQAWRESPTLDKTSPFLERVYREDVGPCLDFTMQELSALVRAAVEDNTLTIEPAASQTPPAVKVAAVECGRTNGFRAPIDTTCALSGLACACRHRIRLGDSESHYYISPSSRARITAVCNFFTYIRYIQQGLVRQDGERPLVAAGGGAREGKGGAGRPGQPQGFAAPPEPMFWEITRLRKEMSLAKLGFFPQEA